MNSNLSEPEKLPWETLFDQATEDISTYRWAAEVWSDLPEGYTPGYLLILLLSHRARSAQALEKMKGILPDEYVPYRDRIHSIWTRSEKILKEDVLPVSDSLKGVIGKELDEWMEELNTSLKKTVHLAQDGDLLNNPDWVAEDLKEEGHDFLLRFQDIALTREALKQFPFLSAELQRIFNQKFSDLEQNFHHSFGYFSPLKDLFLSLKEREYNLDRWWLTTLPQEKDVQEEEIPDQVMVKLKQAYQTPELVLPSYCSDQEKLIAYALNELDPEECQKVETHIHKCQLCLELVLDVRLAEAEAREKEKDVLEVSSELWEAINGEAVSTRDNLKSFLSKHSAQLADWFSNKIENINDLVRDLPANLSSIITNYLSLQPAYAQRPVRLLLGTSISHSKPPLIKVNEGFEIHPLDGKLILLDMENPPNVLKEILNKKEPIYLYWMSTGWLADGTLVKLKARSLSEDRLLILEDQGWEILFFCLGQNQETLVQFVESFLHREPIEKPIDISWVWYRIVREV